MKHCHRISALLFLFVFTLPSLHADVATVIVDPPSLSLSGPSARYQLLVHEKLNDASLFDLTRSAKYRVSDGKVASISDAGMVRVVGDGQTTIIVEARGKTLTIPIKVEGTSVVRPFHFENDIVPILGRFGCNSSGCHGKAEGQNGFKLSVFGFDPQSDYAALLKEGRGRRILPSTPERSLLLTKAAGQVPHGGGLRIPANSEAFETLRAWIAAGTPIGAMATPRVESIRIEPEARVVGMKSGQQLRVLARYTDGREIDVTTLARFQSNNDAVATMTNDGYVQTSDVPGEAAIMAGFLSEVASSRILVPLTKTAEFPKLPVNNFIDPLVDNKLKKLNLIPSGPVDDNTFIRRVFIDIIGTLPRPDEVRAFTKDTNADKREKLVDALLQRPEYADYWALKWSDLLRVDRATLGHKRAYAYYRWIRESIAENKPFDRFARELITAEGLIDETPATNFYRVVTKPGDAANSLSQVFLGIRIACAECHHHPYDRWGQDDYHRLSAYFAPLSVKKVGGLDVLSATGDSFARNPRTNETLTAAPLGSRIVPLPLAAQMIGAKRLLPDGKGDRRMGFAEWLVSPRNPWFAKNVVNRYWDHFFGRGIVEPVDDVRATNPPTNPELLDALAKHLDEVNYDLKKLIRTIVLSRTYQTSSTPNESNMRDEQNYSRSLFRRYEAEVLLDAVSQTLGVPEKFDGSPLGTRAIQLWDSKVKHYTLKTFGRPSRTSSCECERVGEPNLASVLHLLNSDMISNKITHEGGAIARMVDQIDDDEKLLHELFMLMYSRTAKPKEIAEVMDYVRKQGAGMRRRSFEDIAWALLNTKEFMFNH